MRYNQALNMPANNKLSAGESHRPAAQTSAKSSVASARGPVVLDEHKKTGWRNFGAIMLVLAVAGIIAIILTAFVFQQYQVDGPSMRITLQNGNRLIVWKVPRTWSRITGHPYIPGRGDIIVFTEPSVNKLTDTGSDQLVKRVIGLPGDHVVVKNNILTIYNKQHPSGFRPDTSLGYGASITKTTSDTECSGTYCDLTVPSGEIYVCGDNRPDSLDSRIFGPVPSSEIIGKLVLRITPASEIKAF
jgi:signal peptidase I